MTLDQYLSRVMPYVQGCPYPLARQAIVEAADEFCRESRVLLERQEIAVAAGDAEITATPSVTGTELIDVEYIRVGEALLECIEPQLLPEAAGGAPAWYWRDGARLHLHPAAKAASQAKLGLVLGVSGSATEIPAALDKWKDGIAAGALFRLTRAVGLPWANPAASQTWGGIFQQEIGRATAEATLGGGKRPLRTRCYP